MKVSILVLNYQRCEMTKKTLEHNLKNTGLNSNQFELLIADQNSQNKEFYDWVDSLKPTYRRFNGHNEGIARSLNQLMLRARGEHMYCLGNDYYMPQDWLKVSVEYADNIPHSGIVGLEGQDLILPEHTVMGLDGKERKIHFRQEEVLGGSQVHGPILITRECLNRIGAMSQSYHPYAFEDTDYAFRCKASGLLVYYIPGYVGDHYGLKNENSDVYRFLKQELYFANLGEHYWRVQNYYKIGLYEKWPEPREVITKEMLEKSI